MRATLATLALLASLAAAPIPVAGAQDVEWAMQDQARGLLGVRAVATEGHLRQEPAAGGELAVGGWLAGWLAMELRVGSSLNLTNIRPEWLVDLWYGLGGRARIAPSWTVSPTLGLALLWHERGHGGDGLAGRAEVGLGVWAGDDAVVVLGVTGSAPLFREAAGYRLEAFLGIDFLI